MTNQGFLQGIWLIRHDPLISIRESRWKIPIEDVLRATSSLHRDVPAKSPEVFIGIYHVYIYTIILSLPSGKRLQQTMEFIAMLNR